MEIKTIEGETWFLKMKTTMKDVAKRAKRDLKQDGKYVRLQESSDVYEVWFRTPKCSILTSTKGEKNWLSLKKQLERQIKTLNQIVVPSVADFKYKKDKEILMGMEDTLKEYKRLARKLRKRIVSNLE